MPPTEHTTLLLVFITTLLTVVVLPTVNIHIVSSSGTVMWKQSLVDVTINSRIGTVILFLRSSTIF